MTSKEITIVLVGEDFETFESLFEVTLYEVSLILTTAQLINFLQQYDKNPSEAKSVFANKQNKKPLELTPTLSLSNTLGRSITLEPAIEFPYFGGAGAQEEIDESLVASVDSAVIRTEVLNITDVP